jgi:streptomycin 6-kinase
MRALELADGRGCARLLRRDDERSAMLIERLGRQLHELGLPVSRQIEIICTTLHDLWRPVPAGAGLPTVAEKGQWLAEFIARIWEDVDRPCSPRVIDRALVFIERRTAAPSGEAVLVHGDAHAWNTLEAGDGRFKLVDPDGLIGEREYDLAIPMREFNEELLAGDAVAIGQGRARFLAHLTGANVGAIWQWGFVERVSTALYSGLLGQEDWARAAFDVAEQWAVADSL